MSSPGYEALTFSVLHPDNLCLCFLQPLWFTHHLGSSFHSQHFTWARSKVNGREVLTHLAHTWWTGSANKCVAPLQSGTFHALMQLHPQGTWVPTPLPLHTSQLEARHQQTHPPLHWFPWIPSSYFLAGHTPCWGAWREKKNTWFHWSWRKWHGQG